MAFLIGLRLPTDVERGAIGGPGFNTSVLRLESGYEKRNENWQDSIGEWDVGYGLVKKFDADPGGAELDVAFLIAMFRTTSGKAHSFRFKDWSDYEVGYQYDQPVDPEFLATGDGVTDEFQAIKRYQLPGLDPSDRIITKLVADTVEIFIDGVQQMSGWSADINRGLITFVAPPAEDAVITTRFQFDCHVRFDTDNLRISMALFNAGEWRDIPIIELLGTGLADA